MSFSAPSHNPTAKVIGRLVGELRVTFHAAKNLAQKELLGTMSPYIQIKVGSDALSTPADHHGGRQPNWKDRIIILAINYEPSELVHFEVKDKRMLGDETIGVSSLELKDVVAYHTVRRWYQLVHKHNFSHIAGDFEATVEFKGDGVEFFPGGAAVVAIDTASPPPSVQPVQYTAPAAYGLAPLAYAPAPAAVASYVAPPTVDAGFVQAEIRAEERELRREERREERREKREIRREEREEHRHHHHH